MIFLNKNVYLKPFSIKEINFSMENSFKPISIGTSRLRTETAGIVACQILNFMYSDD